MNHGLVLTALAAASFGAQAQTADVQTSSAAQSGALSIGGGSSNTSINSAIGGNRNRNIARGGDSSVIVNLGSGDPAAAQTVAPSVNAQQVPAGETTSHIREDLKTTGNPGAMSFGVSFSQYNCANTAGGGVGFMGGVVQIGGGLESTPCNDRANASAFFQIAQTLATSNPQLSAQLFHAAILLVGNSTKDTQAALAAAGVSDWAPTPAPATVVPPAPAAPVTPPAEEGRTGPVPTPSVAVTPLPVQVMTVSTQVPATGPQTSPQTSATVTAEALPAVTLPAPDDATEPDIEQIKAIMFQHTGTVASQ
jgi:hypothetical protein